MNGATIDWPPQLSLVTVNGSDPAVVVVEDGPGSAMHEMMKRRVHAAGPVCRVIECASM